MSLVLSYLTETATLFRRTGVNAFGEDVRDGGREVCCRVRLKRVAAHRRGGETRRYPGEVWLAPDEAIAPGDQVLYDGDYLTVVAVESVVDVAGITAGLRALVE